MIWFATEKQQKESMKHAGGKAREDIEKIVKNQGIMELPIIQTQNDQMKDSILKKIIRHFNIFSEWKKSINKLNNSDILIVQFPLINSTLFFSSIVKYAKRRGIRTYAFIHDLEVIRLAKYKNLPRLRKYRIKFEERFALKSFDGIVVHNKKMKNFLQKTMEIPVKKMCELEIFDYLIDKSYSPCKQIDNFKSCIIAGNLSKIKSSYVYKLPSEPKFELYGINFEGETANNINYHGAYLANELPFHLKGGFGLVWDGDSSLTCSGVTGEYLKYNNPHKTSLYLACGIPVIIWREAALADFILDNEVGFTINSLEEINMIFSSMTELDYYKYKTNAVNMSKKLREGSYTTKALEFLLSTYNG